MPRRRPPFTRPQTPPDNIRLTARDIAILEAIHAHDGMLSLRQIDRLYFSGRGSAHPRQRMNKLFVNHYVNRPGPQAMHRIPYGKTVYWLDTRGAQVVAGVRGETLASFTYRKDIRWSLVAHDLRVSDVRIAVAEACEKVPELEVRRWEWESAFRARPDTVTYSDGNGRKKRRRVIPDSYFLISRRAPGMSGSAESFAFLLELDMATEHNPRVGRSKVLPGMAYIGSESYRERFGLRYGRWLFVTTGERRRDNMRAQARRLGAKSKFYFTTYDRLTPETILSEPIWWMPDRDAPVRLIP